LRQFNYNEVFFTSVKFSGQVNAWRIIGLERVTAPKDAGLNHRETKKWRILLPVAVHKSNRLLQFRLNKDAAI
jgi:hypothetical protein